MKTNKDFDCVKMMREIRDKINSEIINMNSAQIIEYFRLKSSEYENKYSQPVTNRYIPQGLPKDCEVHSPPGFVGSEQ